MEVFATIALILLAGLALPIVLLISGLLFDLLVVIYTVVETRVSRKRKPRSTGAVAGSGEVRRIGWAG